MVHSNNSHCECIIPEGLLKKRTKSMQAAFPETLLPTAPPGGSGSASWSLQSWSGVEEMQAVIRRLTLLF